MATLFGILETGSRALFAQQTALSVTGNNIANVNTPGYSRQRVNLVTTADMRIPPRPQGMGVRVASITRYRSEFLDYQIRKERSTVSYLGRMAELLGQTENILNDPLSQSVSATEENTETGLNATMIRFFDTFQELSLDPESVGIRSNVRETAITLTNTFNQIDRQMSDLLGDINQGIHNVVDEANSILEQLLHVNQQIARIEIEPSANANNLRDQRDLLLTELSNLVPIEVNELESGAVNVRIFGVNAVQPQSINRLQTVSRPNDPNQFVDITIENGEGVILNTQITSGELGALLQARDSAIPEVQERLDELAFGLIREINAIHSASAGLEGFTQLTGTTGVANSTLALSTQGLDFPTTTGSFDIVVRDADGNPVNTYTINFDPAVDSLDDLATAIDLADGVVGGGDLTASVNASNQLVITSGTGLEFIFQGDSSGVLSALGMNTFFTGTDARTIAVNQLIQDNLSLIAASSDGTPGNNEAALQMAQLREAQVLSDGTADFHEFYQSTVAVLGTQVQRLEQLESNTSLLVDSLEIRQEELAGVSLDEEAVNLVRFQQAFNAAARLITSVDEMIETVVERMGIVGR